MLLANEYREEVKEWICEESCALFDAQGVEKSRLLEENTLYQMWISYQKSVEEYRMDPYLAFRLALEEVAGIPSKTAGLTIHKKEN